MNLEHFPYGMILQVLFTGFHAIIRNHGESRTQSPNEAPEEPPELIVASPNLFRLPDVHFDSLLLVLSWSSHKCGYSGHDSGESGPHAHPLVTRSRFGRRQVEEEMRVLHGDGGIVGAGDVPRAPVAMRL